MFDRQRHGLWSAGNDCLTSHSSITMSDTRELVRRALEPKRHRLVTDIRKATAPHEVADLIEVAVTDGVIDEEEVLEILREAAERPVGGKDDPGELKGGAS